jgi:hypothetical protein
MAMTLALKETIWIKYFLRETMLFPNQPLLLHCENMLAIIFAKNLEQFELTKCIAMKL